MSNPNVIGHTIQQSQGYKANGKPIRWSCICPGYSTNNKKPELYRQTGASAMGVGLDWAVAMEMQAREKYGTDMSSRGGVLRAPVHILGGLAAGRLDWKLKERRTQLLSHNNCVIERQLPALPQIVQTQTEDIFQRGQQIWPELSTDRLEQVADIYDGLKKLKRISPVPQAKRELAEGGTWRQNPLSYGWNHPPIEQRSLMQIPAQPHFVADYRKGAAYNPTDEELSPVYHLSMGDMKREIITPLGTFMDFEPEYFLAATAVRHAAITVALDIPATNIHTIR